MSILGIDCGFGDNKITFGSETSIEKMFKFSSVVGVVKRNDLVSDNRIYDYKGNSYYVGELALSLESNKILDTSHYVNLEMFSPLFIDKVINDIDKVPEIIVCGLSIAHVANSGHYRKAIVDYVHEKYNPQIKVGIIPQGIGGKLTIDRYGMNFPGLNTDFAEGASYISCDVGFNTLDILQVTDGKTSPNLIRGIEQQGVIKIVQALLAFIKETYGTDFTLKEGKDILDKGFFKVRGQEYHLENVISRLKSEYLKNLEELIEKEFGQVLDKVNFLYLFGGGAYMFTDKVSDFIKVPKAKAEFYNSIGNYLYGKTL